MALHPEAYPPKLSGALPLKAFTPRPDTKYATELHYTDSLEGEAGKIIDESRRQYESRQATSTIEREQSERHLNTSYLVYIAFRLMNEETDSYQHFWAESFTQKSIELYGQPDAELANTLLTTQIQDLLYSEDQPASLVKQYVDALTVAEIPTPIPDHSSEMETKNPFGFDAARDTLSHYLNETYGDVFEALDAGSYTEPLNPEEIAAAIERGLEVLRAHDEAWSQWSVDRSETKDSLSVDASSKSIIVGMKRANMAPDALNGLFAHEVLRHAQTAINGRKNGIPALPGYIEFEEGMGVFHEYALSGTLKDEMIDRYTDIALALGMHRTDGQRLSRTKLTPVALAREQLRNTLRPAEEQLSDDEMRKKVYAHINRIYRGTPGSDTVIGVFTKDIAYLNGFLKAGSYIESQLEGGKPIDALMGYISQGKFDATQQSHIEALEARSQPATSKELTLHSQVVDIRK